MIDDPTNPAREQGPAGAAVQRQGLLRPERRPAQKKVDDIAIVRVEQLYPFPQKEIQAILAKYRNATEVVWVQEEPRNRGAWTFMQDRLQPMLPETAVLNYVGRDEAASPATGSHKMHEVEEQELVVKALDLPPATKPAPNPAAAASIPSSNGNGNGLPVNPSAPSPEPAVK